jgi:hypothetical protein
MGSIVFDTHAHLVAAIRKQIPTSSASRAMIAARNPMSSPGKTLTDAEVDAIYGLEPVIAVDPAGMDSGAVSEFVTVHCPYCGEAFESRADASAGSCSYVEDCQVCCQPIEMTLRVEGGVIVEFTAHRGDS